MLLTSAQKCLNLLCPQLYIAIMPQFIAIIISATTPLYIIIWKWIKANCLYIQKFTLAISY